MASKNDATPGSGLNSQHEPIVAVPYVEPVVSSDEKPPSGGRKPAKPRARKTAQEPISGAGASTGANGQKKRRGGAAGPAGEPVWAKKQHDFLTTLAGGCPDGLHFLVAEKRERPDGRTGFPAEKWREQRLVGPWYFSTGASSHRRLRTKANMKSLRAIVIDDVGTKVKPERIKAKPTWIIETSKGNYQWGFLLESWTDDIHAGDELVKGLVAAGLQDKGVNTCCRLFRLPGSVNDKGSGGNFVAELHLFDVEQTYTLESLALALEVTPVTLERHRTLQPEDNPFRDRPDILWDWLVAGGYVRHEATGGWWEVDCPWPEEHLTNPGETCKVMPRNAVENQSSHTNIMCHHGHGEDGPAYRQRFLDWVVEQGGPDYVIAPGIRPEVQDILRKIMESKTDWGFGKHDAPKAVPNEPEVVLIDADTPAPAPLPEEPMPAAGVWPKPRRGIMAAAVKWICDGATKPQPELALLSTIVSFGTAAGSQYHLPDGMRCNQYGICLLPTGEGKDYPLGCAAEMGKAAGARVIGKAASGEGLEDEMVEASKGGKPVLQPRDEFAHIIKSLEGTQSPPHLISLNGAYLEFFSASRRTYRGRSRSGKPGVVIENPALSILGFCVPSEMGKALKTSGILSGLVNRILWTTGRDDVTPRLLDETPDIPDAVREALEAVARRRGTIPLAGALSAAADAAGKPMENPASAVIRYAPDLKPLRQQLQIEFDAAAKGGDERTRALYQRSFEKALRVAGAIAVVDNPQSPVITREILEWAAAFVRASDATLARFVIDHMTGGEQQTWAKTILTWCKEVRAALEAAGKGTKAQDNLLKKRFPTASAAEQEWLRNGYFPARCISRALRDLDVKQRDMGLEYLDNIGEMCVVFHKDDGRRATKLVAFGTVEG